MSRNFYSSAILFASLYVMIVLITSVASFQLGQRLGELPSFSTWYLIQLALSFIWLLILLKYFHGKEYWITFWGLAILIASTFIHFALSIRVFSTNEITNSYVIAAHVVPAANALFGISLIFSKSKKRYWLKVGGIFLLFIGLITFTGTAWVSSSLTALHDGSATKMTQWALILEIIAPILLLLNFNKERLESQKLETSNQETLSSAISFVVFAAFLSMSFYGYKLNAEIKNLSDNTNYNEYESKLAHPFEARTFTNDHGKILQYRLLKPLNYDSNRTYPLVISLHGASGRGNDNVKQVSRSLFAQSLSRSNNRVKYPAFVLVPQCPPYADWGGITNIEAVDSLVLDVIFALEKEFAIDKNRRYITGISMGGFGVWHLISTQPDMFAAAIPICGAGNPKLAENLTDIPIWAFHGAKDRNVLVRGSQDMIEAIKNEGGDPNYTEFPDKAHHISKDVIDTSGLLDWLFAQERE